MTDQVDDARAMAAGTAGPHEVALVAGASRGLGLQLSAELLRRGWVVYGCARDARELRKAQIILRREVGEEVASRFVTSECDVRDADAVSAWVDQAAKRSGRVDAAFHVAGVIQVGPLESITMEHLHEAVDTMLWGPVHLSLSLIPTLREQGHGRVGIISSVGGLVSVPHLLPYSVAKFGAVGLAEGLFAELSGSGVTVTSVTPGLMRTGGHARARFVGDSVADYAWFAPMASLPLVSISVERAARRIVDGVLRGSPTVELTPLTIVGRRVHGVAPATTIRVMGRVSRLLPRGPRRAHDSSGSPGVEGRVARRDVDSRLVKVLSVLGDRAARRHNEDP